MMNKIFFDMDGTIANFYGVDGWLESIIARDTRPYEMAEPLFNFSTFARQLHRLQRNGFEVGIITWLPKNSTAEYNARVEKAKREWLAKHLPSVEWNEIIVLEYGTPKHEFGCGCLFDDEIGNREAWGENAFDVENILEILRKF